MTICLDCGRKNDKKHKKTMGVWNDNCEMCGAIDVACADAGHDFGIYSNEKERIHDETKGSI